MQGDVFGPIQCCVSVDTYGKECLNTYKGEVGVPPLAMVDDLMIVTECGYKASMANAYINAKSNLKELQFGTDKCHKMHVGKRVEEICPDLFVDGWSQGINKRVAVVAPLPGNFLEKQENQETSWGRAVPRSGKAWLGKTRQCYTSKAEVNFR
jgi:hypothetical protein